MRGVGRRLVWSSVTWTAASSMRMCVTSLGQPGLDQSLPTNTRHPPKQSRTHSPDHCPWRLASQRARSARASSVSILISRSCKALTPIEMLIFSGSPWVSAISVRSTVRRRRSAISNALTRAVSGKTTATSSPPKLTHHPITSLVKIQRVNSFGG